MSREADNKRVLDETQRLQNDANQRLANIQRTLVETTEVADHVGAELARQDEQLKNVDESMGHLHNALDKSKSLLDRFDRWAFRRTNTEEVSAEARAQLHRNDASLLEHRSLYENQRFDSLTRQWKECFLPHDPSPYSYADGSAANEVLGGAKWRIDFAEPTIDAEGWCYAFDFPNYAKPGGKISASPSLFHFVRRRKWRYEEAKSEVVDTISAKYSQSSRTGGRAGGVTVNTGESTPPMGTPSGASPAGGPAAPGLRAQPTRSRVQPTDPSLTRSLFSGGPRGVDTSYVPQGAESLSEVEQARLRQVEADNRAMDSAIDSIDSLVGGLHSRAKTINETVKNQNKAISSLEAKMDDATMKLAENNIRAKKSVLKG